MAVSKWERKELDNLTELAELTEETLLSSIRKRYDDGIVYTDLGDILVSVNPFREMPIYTEEWSRAYNRPDVAEMPPHIFRSASRAFAAMFDCKKDQVFVISGESGAGKTESAKLLMKQIMTMCRSGSLGRELQNRIVQTNPLLEAFGNAQTVLNKNSSRFGKFLQLFFLEDGRIAGAGFEEYLVEKSRVAKQSIDERNFHIFYYLFAGLSQKDRDKLGLTSPLEHRYLRSHPNVVKDCSSEESRGQFGIVMESLKCVGFLDAELDDIINMLAIVLHIGDIEFEGVDGCEDSASVMDTGILEFVCKLIGLEVPEDLAFALTTLRTITRGEAIDKKYSCVKAGDVRDAVAKAIYQRMFRYIIHHINMTLEPVESDDYLHLGILDIFGFEIFTHNNFEQMCINLANEQLQQYFNHQIFAMEKAEYAKEGVDGLDIQFKDNKGVLDLFLTRPIGLLSLLEEQSRSPKGSDDSYVRKCKEVFRKNPHFVPHKGDFPIFTVQHYAADVEYEAKGFLEKNTDSLPLTVVSLLQTSSNLLVYAFFNRPESIDATMKKRPVLKRSQRTAARRMSTLRRPTMRRRQSQVGGGKVHQLSRASNPRTSNKALGVRRVQTVSTYFRESLELLMERLFAASPHFIRCIKPNQKQLANSFNADFVLRQMRYTGMVEAVRVRRQGYAFRPFFSDFTNEFRAIAFNFTERVHPSEGTCRQILEKAKFDGWKMGKSRVFLRYYHEEMLHGMIRDMHTKATRIQKVYRGYKTRKRTTPLLKKAHTDIIQAERFLFSIPATIEGVPDRLIALNHIDIKLKDKRFPKVVAEKTKPLYTGLDYHSYGMDRHRWPGEESDETRPPKPWMVPAIPMATGPQIQGYSPQRQSKQSKNQLSGNGSRNGDPHVNGSGSVSDDSPFSPRGMRLSMSMDNLDEVEEEVSQLPRAQLRKSDSIDDLTLKKHKKRSTSQEPEQEDETSGVNKRVSRISKIKDLLFKNKEKSPKPKSRVRSETEAAPTPTAPPVAPRPHSHTEESQASVTETVYPLGFYPEVSVEQGKVLTSDQEAGSYIVVPSPFRSLYGEEYVLFVSHSTSLKTYPISRLKDSTVMLREEGERENIVARKKFFSVGQLIEYYKKHNLPDGVKIKRAIILGGVRVAGLKGAQSKHSPEKLSPSPSKGKVPWKRRHHPPISPIRKDWEI